MHKVVRDLSEINVHREILREGILFWFSISYRHDVAWVMRPCWGASLLMLARSDDDMFVAPPPCLGLACGRLYAPILSPLSLFYHFSHASSLSPYMLCLYAMFGPLRTMHGLAWGKE